MTQPAPHHDLQSWPATAERQLERAPRTLTLLMAARLITGGGEGLCRLRNISATGMMIETGTPLAGDQPLGVELRNGRVLTGRAVWTRDGRAGVHFDAPASVEEVVALQGPVSRVRRGRQPRSPRIAVAAVSEVRMGATTLKAQVKDISQGGACIALPVTAAAEERMMLAIPGLPMKLAIVRWSGERTGLVFAEPLPFELLSRWLGEQPSP